MSLAIFVTGMTLHFLGGVSVDLVFQNGAGDYSGATDVSIASDLKLRDRNFGKRDYLHLWPEGDGAFIRFDLERIPADAKIKSSSLKVFSLSVGFTPEELQRKWQVWVHGCKHEWTEGTGDQKGLRNGIASPNGATFNTWNGKDPWPNASVRNVVGKRIGGFELDKSEEWYSASLDVDMVAKWVADKTQNKGLVLFGLPPGKAVSFSSSEYAEISKRPRLEMNLEVTLSQIRDLLPQIVGRVTWDEYLADCGIKSQDANEARSEECFRARFAGRTVGWEGRVANVVESADGYTLSVLMNPTESILSTADLWLTASKSDRETLLSLTKGDKIRFVGRFVKQGGHFLNHELDLILVERIR